MQDEKPTVQITTQDLIYAQVQDLGKRMDRLERRMDKLEEKFDTNRRELNQRLDKQDDKIERLSDKIDALRRDLTGGVNHNQIMTGSIVAIALSVIFYVATH